MPDLLICTDLDGTLLNHHNYRFDEAQEALDIIRERQIPLILVTSKTFSEVVDLQEALQIRQPFIVENGAGIYIPVEYPLAQENRHHENGEWIKLSQAKSYLESRLFIKAMQPHYQIRGFGDMDVSEVMALTGLTQEESKKAMRRDFTEPFTIEDPTLIPALTQEANRIGLDIIEGGRFFHLLTLYQDKAKAVSTLKLLYEEYFSKTFHVIALGDSANDFTMLEHADSGVLIPKMNGSYAPFTAQGLIKAPYCGARGWNHALLELLDAY